MLELGETFSQFDNSSEQKGVNAKPSTKGTVPLGENVAVSAVSYEERQNKANLR